MHDPFRERDLDARFVERDLDPLAEFAGDRPLTKRLGSPSTLITTADWANSSTRSNCMGLMMLLFHASSAASPAPVALTACITFSRSESYDIKTLVEKRSRELGLSRQDVNPERHEYELYLAVEDIDHSRTKTKSPQTNGICERFHKTVLNEFYRVAFRKGVPFDRRAAGRPGRMDHGIR
jgi:hypothetical protein